MQLPILKVPDPILRQKSTELTDFTPEIHEFILDMAETLKKAKDPEGVGLSAPQLGKNIQAFTTYLDKKIKFYINPKLVDISDETTLGGNPDKPVLEGCLSIPHLYGPVQRPKKIKIKAIDEKGEKFTKTYSSFRARVFLHELDHLNGILFTDYTLKENLPLYFLEDDEFIRIENPKAIIKW